MPLTVSETRPVSAGTDRICGMWFQPKRTLDGQRGQLCYLRHVETENRNGLMVNSRLTQAHGRAEPSAALEIFGWLKTVGGLRKTRHRGVARVGWMFTLALAAYNLVRMLNLLPAPA